MDLEMISDLPLTIQMPLHGFDNLLITPRGHVIDSAGVFDAERAEYKAGIVEKAAMCNKRGLTLRCPQKAR